jgi:hypothetical protein
LLTEAAWHYRFPARLSGQLRERSKILPEPVRNRVWKAQLALRTRFMHLSSRGVQPNKVCVAVAPDLTGFVWASARQASSRASTESPPTTSRTSVCSLAEIRRQWDSTEIFHVSLLDVAGADRTRRFTDPLWLSYQPSVFDAVAMAPPLSGGPFLAS